MTPLTVGINVEKKANVYTLVVEIIMSATYDIIYDNYSQLTFLHKENGVFILVHSICNQWGMSVSQTVEVREARVEHHHMIVGVLDQSTVGGSMQLLFYR